MTAFLNEVLASLIPDKWLIPHLVVAGPRVKKVAPVFSVHAVCQSVLSHKGTVLCAGAAVDATRPLCDDPPHCFWDS